MTIALSEGGVTLTPKDRGPVPLELDTTSDRVLNLVASRIANCCQPIRSTKANLLANAAVCLLMAVLQEPDPIDLSNRPQSATTPDTDTAPASPSAAMPNDGPADADVADIEARLSAKMEELDVLLDGQTTDRVRGIAEKTAAEEGGLHYPEYPSLRLFARSPAATLANAPGVEVFLASEVSAVALALSRAKTYRLGRERNTDQETDRLFDGLGAGSVRCPTLDLNGREAGETLVISMATVAAFCGIPEKMIRDAVALDRLPPPDRRFQPYHGADPQEGWSVEHWRALASVLDFSANSQAEQRLRAPYRKLPDPTWQPTLKRLQASAKPYDVYERGRNADTAIPMSAIPRHVVQKMCPRLTLPEATHRIRKKGIPWAYTLDDFAGLAKTIHEHIRDPELPRQTELEPHEHATRPDIRQLLENAMRERDVIGSGRCRCLTVGDIARVYGKTRDDVLEVLVRSGYDGGSGIDAKTREPAFSEEFIDDIEKIFVEF